MLEVLVAGPLTTVQDLGRPGYAHLGVPRSGALDGPALRAANRLVGNDPGAAGLEITLAGCRVRPGRAVTIAVTGAPATVTVDGAEVAFGAGVAVRPGQTVHIGRCIRGVRSYLAVDGGLAVPAVLGSRSTDTLSGLGPHPLRNKDILPLGPPGTAEPSEIRQADTPSTVELRVRPGPRDDWFTAAAWDVLCGHRYQVTPMSNRVGARLAGPGLSRAVAGELPSEGMVLGGVQVPADGQPLVFLADHPTTGGYPVIGVVHPADLPLLAQARPGSSVVFHGPQR
jgi:biotin-dependent carboxylase-like uncharacterized protein